MYKYEALTAVLQWSGKMVNKYGEREKAPNKLHEPVPLFPTFLLLYITCNIMHLHVHVYLCSKKMEHSQAEHCDKRRQCCFFPEKQCFYVSMLFILDVKWICLLMAKESLHHTSLYRICCRAL